MLELGGFLPDSGPGRVHEEDRMLLTQTHLSGLSAAQCPQPTYWYRDASGARHEWFNHNEWSCRAESGSGRRTGGGEMAGRIADQGHIVRK